MIVSAISSAFFAGHLERDRLVVGALPDESELLPGQLRHRLQCFGIGTRLRGLQATEPPRLIHARMVDEDSSLTPLRFHRQ